MSAEPKQRREHKPRHSTQRPRKRSRMLADQDTPWVSVGTLKEKMFCDRAAIIVSESSQDQDEDGLFAFGQYRAVPLYTLQAISRALKQRLLWLAGWTCFCGLALIVTTTLLAPQQVVFSIPVLVIGGFFWLKTLWHVLQLLGQQARAKTARSRVPDLDKDEIQDTYWWGMVAAGFDVKRPHEALSDPNWRVVGKPWRVLQRHQLRIPVIRVRMEDPRIVKQHFARVAAYCHLLEKTEPGVSSPGGIILFTPGYDGKFLPNNPRSSSTFHGAVVDTRELLSLLRDRRHTPNPPAPGRCSGCPHGRPTSRNRGFSYESECGTRFGWTPPHNRAFEKGLR